MAENPKASQGDLVNLDDATQGMLESGSGASSGDSIINAAEIFQQQLEQMTTWKQKLGQQMDLLRRDGVKLMERQKALAIEKNTLIDERADIEKQRDQIRKLQLELDAEGSRLSLKAGELEALQRRLAEMQTRREREERELSARQRSLEEQEIRHLAEDVRLKEGLEQLEGERRRLTEAHRQATQDRESLDRQLRELAARSCALDEKDKALEGREGNLSAGRQELEKAQTQLRAHQADMAARERGIGEKLAALEADMQARAAAAQTETQRLADERLAIAKQKHELQRRMEEFEQEQAEQLEALGKQTKRLAERRVHVDAAENDLEAALASRIAQATDALKAELANARNGNDQRVNKLEQELKQIEETTRRTQQQETELHRDATSLREQLDKLKEELRGATTSLERVSSERSLLANQLAEQIEQGEHEAEKWQKQLDQAQMAGEDKLSQKAQAQAAAHREKIDALKTQVKQLQSTKDELEFQLEIRVEESGKQLEAQRKQLALQLSLRDEEISELKQKLEAVRQQTTATSAQETQHVAELTAQVQTLDQQRNEMAAQLASVQEKLWQEQEQAQQAKTELQGQVTQLQRQNTELAEAQAAYTGGAKVRSATGGPEDAQLYKQTGSHRQRLLRQARALRMFRQQIRESQSSLEKGRSEISQQREQIRSRKENLEQVKRLLEKQEMVMARKLADHNAVKTVAAVGIFVILVVASVFFGVYRFMRPVYRSEAVVQLAVPETLQGADAEAWVGKQMAFIRSNELTYGAWKVLRSSEEHYSMNDVREEWLGTLPDHLSISRDAGGKTLAIRYTGPDAEGVSQVCNALATAYINPGMRDTTEETKSLGLGAQEVAKATVPAMPAEDSRLVSCAIGVGVVLLISALLVMILRHFVARQLREIDDMTEADDLAEAADADGIKPAIE